MTELDHLARLYRDIFEIDARGAAVLEDLVKRFARGPAQGFSAEAVQETFVRAHQRKMLDHILAMINRANGAPDPNANPEGEAP